MEFGYEDSCKIASAALHQSLAAKVRFGSSTAAPLRRSRDGNTLMCGRLRVGKNFLHYAAALVGAAMCSAFKRGSHDRWP
jgi:hypothetical protein